MQYAASTVFLGQESCVLPQFEMCRMQKIPVCIEERQLPPTFLVKKLSSVGLSILKQPDIRRNVQRACASCAWSTFNLMLTC